MRSRNEFFGIVRSSKYIPWFLVVCTLTTVGSLSTLAQNATILGTVTDPSGAAVPNVHITVTDLDTNQANTFVTNGVGQYVAPELPIRRYTIKAEATNFQLATQQNISLGVGDRRRIDFQLKVGNAQQTVTVEANTVAVQSDTGEQSYLINGQQVTQLSTHGRSMYTLETLTPGASSLQQDFQVPTSAGGDANVSFNGLREGDNLWLIDGGEASDRGGAGGSDVMPSIDAC